VQILGEFEIIQYLMLLLNIKQPSLPPSKQDQQVEAPQTGKNGTKGETVVGFKENVI
jgi:hypothetical protein